MDEDRLPHIQWHLITQRLSSRDGRRRAPRHNCQRKHRAGRGCGRSDARRGTRSVVHSCRWARRGPSRRLSPAAPPRRSRRASPDRSAHSGVRSADWRRHRRPWRKSGDRARSSVARISRSFARRRRHSFRYREAAPRSAKCRRNHIWPSGIRSAGVGGTFMQRCLAGCKFDYKSCRLFKFK